MKRYFAYLSTHTWLLLNAMLDDNEEFQVFVQSKMVTARLSGIRIYHYFKKLFLGQSYQMCIIYINISLTSSNGYIIRGFFLM